MKRFIKKINKKKTSIAVFTLLAVMTAATLIYAKYIKEINNVVAPIGDHVAEYYMDVIWHSDDDDTDNGMVLSQKLSLNEINPGEFQTISFMVRNGNGLTGDECQISDIDFTFSVNLIHTENLPLTYTLYQYTGTDEEGNPQYSELTDYSEYDSNEDRNSVNTGLKRVYSTAVNDDLEFWLKGNSKDAQGNRVVDARKFRLVISWDDDSITGIDNKYTREVDDVYIVINATQKEHQ